MNGEEREGLEAVLGANPFQGTDAAEIALFEDALTGQAIVICAIDNLGKGAAGQAIQNWNVMLGVPETTGLSLTGWPCT